jgi:FkbM family methyltransferase
MEINLTEVLTNFVDMSYIDAGSIVIDAGACLGLFIEDLRRNPEASKCRVIALECNTDNVKVLMSKNLHNVNVHNRALVGQDTPERTLFYQYLGFEQWGATRDRVELGLRRKSKGVKKYIVRTVRINNIFDYFNIDHIDFLKMDIEGTEMDVLGTMTQETASRIKQLSIEVHITMDNRPPIKKRLEQLGYEAQLLGKDVVYGMQNGGGIG